MQNITVWVTVLAYIGMLVCVGLFSRKRSKNIADFTVGGRNAGAWLSALSYGTAYFSAVMFVGYAGKTGLEFGLWGVLAGIGNAVFGSLLAWAVLARKTRDISARLKIQTMPEFFEKRYHSKTMRTFSAAIIFIFLVPYSASVYSGLASVADVLLGIDDTIFLLIIAALAMLLVTLGGYLVQARADFIQGIVMMVGIVLLLIFVVRCDRVGGVEGLVSYAHTQAGLPQLNVRQWVSLSATVLMTSFGTWGLPQMVQKYFGIKSDAQAKRGIVISTVFALLIAGGGYFIGALCHTFYTKGVDMPAADSIVPMMLKDANLPAILLGIIIVLLLSASVSTLCSITISAASAGSVDLLGRLKKDATAEKKAKWSKILAALFVLLSYLVANTKTPILDMMSYSWGILSGSFLAPYVLALYSKKVNTKGAWAGILSGFCVAFVPAACKFLTIFGLKTAAVTMLAGQGPLFACAAMIISILLCYSVSLLTVQKNQQEVTDFFYNGVVKVD